MHFKLKNFLSKHSLLNFSALKQISRPHIGSIKKSKIMNSLLKFELICD